MFPTAYFIDLNPNGVSIPIHPGDGAAPISLATNRLSFHDTPI
jgi:hypothetical protein